MNPFTANKIKTHRPTINFLNAKKGYQLREEKSELSL